jgi:hypothetical protein
MIVSFFAIKAKFLWPELKPNGNTIVKVKGKKEKARRPFGQTER